MFISINVLELFIGFINAKSPYIGVFGGMPDAIVLSGSCFKYPTKSLLNELQFTYPQKLPIYSAEIN